MADSHPPLMQAMVLEAGASELSLQQIAVPTPSAGQVLIRIHACGVCRTDLHILDAELAAPVYPIIPGHEIVGTLVELGSEVKDLSIGQRVGVPWLGWTCGECSYCQQQRENLCDHAAFTGYQLPGGFADYTCADARYCFPLPDRLDDLHSAPLLCAGLIGFRALRMAGDAQRIGLYGFGAAAHIIAQVAIAEQREVYAFTRPGDESAQAFARQLGVHWAGDSDCPPPTSLDAAILFAPIGALVPQALSVIKKGGRVVCAGIHMSDIPGFAYELLWQERELVSVANLTRQDGLDFFRCLADIPVNTEVTAYALGDANQALDDLRHGRFNGAAVLLMDK